MELSERANQIAREIEELLPLNADFTRRHKIAAIIAKHLSQPAQPREIWDAAIAAVRSVYMQWEPLSSPDREHYATWQTAVTDCEKALERARDAPPPSAEEKETTDAD